MASAFELIEAQIADPDAQWSLGTFGAIADSCVTRPSRPRLTMPSNRSRW